jgi:hypothetical protein
METDISTSLRVSVQHWKPVVRSSIAEAAALLAETDAPALAANGTLLKDYTSYEDILDRPKDKRANSTKCATSSGYWLANKEHLGAWPYNSDSSYEVFGNVRDYGAAEDGYTVSNVLKSIL